MFSSVRRVSAVVLTALAVLGPLSPLAQAQRRPLAIPSLPAFNPNPYVNPSQPLGQAAYNTAVLGQALSNIPPYALGYNPYPQVANYGPSYPVVNPLGAGVASP